jgi:large conductance mechanosensitive channel
MQRAPARRPPQGLAPARAGRFVPSRRRRPHERTSTCPLLRAGRPLTGGAMLKEFRDFVMRGSVVELAIKLSRRRIPGMSRRSSATSSCPRSACCSAGLTSPLFIGLPGQPCDAGRGQGGRPDAQLRRLRAGHRGLCHHRRDFLLIRQVNHSSRRWRRVTTRPCPLCLSNIPLRATRCAHCTSEARLAGRRWGPSASFAPWPHAQRTGSTPRVRIRSAPPSRDDQGHRSARTAGRRLAPGPFSTACYAPRPGARETMAP